MDRVNFESPEPGDMTPEEFEADKAAEVESEELQVYFDEIADNNRG